MKKNPVINQVILAGTLTGVQGENSMQSFGGPFQVILAGTLTGLQGDIRCEVLAALSTAK